ncbi:MAG: Gfo/Idh/MocA family oxidoreductase [Yersiniaceae bacterium]|nr:Gfo/Idh/MocA family oxidoreductase [Yersiniaceae bacterium]
MSDDQAFPYENRGPATAIGHALPAAGAPLPPSGIDSGRVDGEQVTFPNWKGAADTPEPSPPVALPPEQRVGFAVVGLGRLTLNQILPALHRSKNARPVALVSGYREKAETVAAQYGIRSDAIYGYDEMQKMADNPEIEAVYIVTPNGLHRDHVLAAAAAGKHVLCEKPMANTSREAQEMIDACQQAGVKLMIAYRCQFDAFNKEAARLVQSGELGRPRIIEATNVQMMGLDGQWRFKAGLAGGGALPDIGLYCLNGVRMMLAENPIEVYAQAVNPTGDPRYAEVEETISFVLRFRSGVIAHCVTSYGAHEGKEMTVRLENGWVKLDNAFAYSGQRLTVAQRKGEAQSLEERKLSAGPQFVLEIEHFADCVRNDRAPRTPGEEGLQDQIFIEAIYRSAQEGRPVTLEHNDLHVTAAQKE